MTLRWLATSFVLMVLGNGGLSGAQTPRQDRIQAVPAPAVVQIDGSLDEWDLSGAIDCIYDAALAPRFTARLAVMYDRQGLYVAAHVVDDSPLMNRHDPRVSAGEAWNADAIQVRLTADPGMPYPVMAATHKAQEGDATSLDARIVHLTLWHYTDRHEDCLTLQRGMDFRDTTVLVGPDAKLRFKPDDDAGGYTMELLLPWQLLGVRGEPPKAGDRLAMTAQFLFSNKAGDRQVMTFNEVVRGAGFHYLSAEQWGLLELSPHGRLTPTAKAQSGGGAALPLRFRVQLPDGEAKQLSVAILGHDVSIRRTLPPLIDPVVERDSDGGSATWVAWDGLDDQGQPLPAGEYGVRLLTHRGVREQYVTSVHNAGVPPWKTDDGRGGWGGDHGPPTAAASDGQRVYLGWVFGEAGSSTIAVDPQLRSLTTAQKLWGAGQALDLGIFVQALAVQDQTLFIAQDGFKFGDHLRPQATCIAGIVLCDAGNGRPMNFPFGQRHLILSHWTPADRDLERVGFNLRGLAVQGDLLFASLFHENRLIQVNWKTGEQTGQWSVPGPIGLAADSDGSILVVSGGSGSVQRLNPTSGQLEVLISGLADPFGVAVDAQRRVYVSDRGAAMQVKVYDHRGQPIRTIGKTGGRPGTGRFEAAGLFKPAGLTVDAQGKLWVTERDDFPRRVSVWDAASGELLGDLMGPGKYAVFGSADPTRPQWVTTHNTLFEVDYEHGTAQTVATLMRPLEPGPRMGLDVLADNRVFFHHLSGRTYLSACGRQNTGIFLLDDKTLSARAVAAFTRGSHATEVVGTLAEELRRQDAAAFDPLWKAANVFWTDGNGDGQVQVAELQASPAGAASLGRYWGSWVDDQLTIWDADDRGGVYRIAVERWREDGTPLYPEPRRIKPWINLADGTVIHSVMPASDRQSVFVIEQRGGNIQQGGGEFQAISRYGSDGRALWSYHPTWVAFALSSPLYQPGYVVGAMKFIGGARLDQGVELLAVNGYHGQFNLLTADGLWVAALGTDNRYSPRLSNRTYLCENFSGFLFRHSGSGKVYLIAGETDCRISEVQGLETLRAGEDRMVISPEDTGRMVRARGQERSGQAASRIVATPMTRPDLSLEDAAWPAPTTLTLDAGAGRGARIALAHDPQRLYAWFDVQDDSPLRNSGGDPALLFKTGDSVNLNLAVNEQADPRRVAAAVGDMRILVTVVDDKPVVVMYEPQIAQGDPRQERTFSSPTGSEVFARVRVLDGAQVLWRRSDSGYRLALALRWSDLGCAAPPRAALRADAGVLFSNPGGNITTLRSFLFNADTQVTQDIPTEARLAPARWGTLEIRP